MSRSSRGTGAGSRRVVIDASVFVDLFAAPDERRAGIAEEVIGWIEGGLVEAYAPRLMLVEVAAVLSRRLDRRDVETAVAVIEPLVTLLPEDTLYDTALGVALETGSRAADAYYIAAAIVTDSKLLTNDRVQALNARRAGIEAYYLLESLEEARRALKSR